MFFTCLKKHVLQQNEKVVLRTMSTLRSNSHFLLLRKSNHLPFPLPPSFPPSQLTPLYYRKILKILISKRKMKLIHVLYPEVTTIDSLVYIPPLKRV